MQQPEERQRKDEGEPSTLNAAPRKNQTHPAPARRCSSEAESLKPNRHGRQDREGNGYAHILEQEHQEFSSRVSAYQPRGSSRKRPNRPRSPTADRDGQHPTAEELFPPAQRTGRRALFRSSRFQRLPLFPPCRGQTAGIGCTGRYGNPWRWLCRYSLLQRNWLTVVRSRAPAGAVFDAEDGQFSRRCRRAGGSEGRFASVNTAPSTSGCIGFVEQQRTLAQRARPASTAACRIEIRPRPSSSPRPNTHRGRRRGWTAQPPLSLSISLAARHPIRSISGRTASLKWPYTSAGAALVSPFGRAMPNRRRKGRRGRCLSGESRGRFIKSVDIRNAAHVCAAG
jgi:hypothetical protein